MTLPPWIKQKAPREDALNKMQEILARLKLKTVCESAHCPNLGECFSRGTSTVMIMGEVCTRNCGFCAVKKGTPEPLSADEPENMARFVMELGLKHVVITSVTRDDLADGGAGHFVSTIKAIRRGSPQTTVEVLIPDFKGKTDSIESLVTAKPDIINHNLETVPSLYTKVRPQANYKQSLNLLNIAGALNTKIHTKSGIMVGLGEKTEEVLELMGDLREVNCDILTIGQYLRPSNDHLPVEEYIEPAVFEKYKQIGEQKGFIYVASAPLVRSSYNADNFFITV